MAPIADMPWGLFSMGVLEKYYLFSAVTERVNYLLASGKCVTVWRDKDSGKVCWKVEWK